MKKTVSIWIMCLVLLLSASWVAAQDAETITVMAHDSFSISKETMAAFEKETHIQVKFLKSGDAGAALNQAILSKNNPMADIFFGVDNTFLSRALKADIFEPYASPLLADIPDQLKLDPQNRLLPVDFGDVCLNYDKAWFKEKGLAPPENLDDLIKPEYKGLTVVENPATSSPGLAFLMATVGKYGEDGYLDFWKKLKANDVLVANGWEEAYYTHFSPHDGDRPLTVSYASSPPVEVYYAEKKLEDAPTAPVLGDGSAFRQIEFIGILKGAENMDAAKKVIDFMLGKTFQEDIPLHMYVFPANKTAALPELFVKYTKVAENPIYLSPDDITAQREKWIEAWTETVLR